MPKDTETAKPADELDSLRQALLRKIVKYARDNIDLNNDTLVEELEKETRSQFEKIISVCKEAAAGAPAKKRIKRKDRMLRKDHISRFFLRYIENQLRKTGVHHSLIAVFANSVHYLADETQILQWTEKINRLMEFGGKKGADYDTILDSKPGKMITEEIMAVYKKEMSKSSGFEKKLKNNLDEALVKNFNPDVDGEMNIEDEVNRSFKEFVKLLQAKR
ncbi:MAG: hypothetical protein G3M78_06660 [Candidatus Nitrohelix vancouverensis]|uniref:Uncharacterized protein n=1 Tax=Candidatus Nitrohelix vancouverensis TaxID=2705534 RepID=A0A7T0C201_9BACT|nr:MAG: hypothetical protein G3M78_06660 [Candidatus Nitrohelix vancouverensis]